MRRKRLEWEVLTDLNITANDRAWRGIGFVKLCGSHQQVVSECSNSRQAAVCAEDDEENGFSLAMAVPDAPSLAGCDSPGAVSSVLDAAVDLVHARGAEFDGGFSLRLL